MSEFWKAKILEGKGTIFYGFRGLEKSKIFWVKKFWPRDQILDFLVSLAKIGIAQAVLGGSTQIQTLHGEETFEVSIFSGGTT